MKTGDLRTRSEWRKVDGCKLRGLDIVAIDIGYSAVKVMSDGVAAAFPSYARRIDGEYLGSPEENTLIYKDISTGESWIVGADALRTVSTLDTNDTEEVLYGRMRYFNDMFRAVAFTGIGMGLLTSRLEDELIIQSGLPAKYVDADSAYLKKVLEGKHDFTLQAGFMKPREFHLDISPEDIDIIPQPMGTLFSVMVGADGRPVPDANRYMSGKVVVFDAGFGTLDIVPIDNHTFNDSQVQTFSDLGMKQVLLETGELLYDEYGQRISVPLLQKGLPTESVRIGYRDQRGRPVSKEVSFSRELAAASAHVCERALARFTDMYDATDLDALVVTGGTSAAWIDHIRDWFSGNETLEIVCGDENTGLGMIYANVRGYYMYRSLAERS